MNIKKTPVLMATVLAVVATTTLATDSAFANNDESQATAQASSCGNGLSSINSLCQELASHIQGDNNDVYISGEQDASETGTVEVTIPGSETGTQEETEEAAEDAEFE